MKGDRRQQSRVDLRKVDIVCVLVNGLLSCLLINESNFCLFCATSN